MVGHFWIGEKNEIRERIIRKVWGHKLLIRDTYWLCISGEGFNIFQKKIKGKKWQNVIIDKVLWQVHEGSI